MTKQLRNIEPVSCAKVLAVLYAILGFFMGALISLFAFIGAVSGALQQAGGGFFGVIFSVGAIIILPAFYAALGALSGFILAALYNLIAKTAGGIELEIE